MWLFFSSISSSEDYYTPGLYSSELECHFDVLNSFVAAGYQLFEAFVVDEGRRIDLPLEAFDGRPMTSSLRELQQQYQQALAPNG